MPSPEDVKEKSEVLETPQFKTLSQAKAYADWKAQVPSALRSVVEGHLIGNKPEIGKEITPLLRQFLIGFQELLQSPSLDIEATPFGKRVKNKLKNIQSQAFDESSVINIFEVFRNPEVPFDQKLGYYKSYVESRLEWLMAQDSAQNDLSEEAPIPSPDADELTPSMDEMEKSPEGPSEYFYEVSPFYGGYYRGHIYEMWDARSLKWKKSGKHLQAARQEELREGTKRAMHGSFTSGKTQAVDMPYGFGIDISSLKVPEGVSAKVFRDQDGIWYLQANSENEKEVQVTFQIGALKSAVQRHGEAVSDEPVHSALPDEVLQKISDAKNSSLSSVSKAKVLCRFVRAHLEYSNDSSYNDLYRSIPSQYFTTLWKNKKADCDVANTFAAEVLRQAGIKVRMVAGHYVKSPSKNGTAQLHGGTGHAWLEVFDEKRKIWERMDATPKGDPNMDEEEQEKDLEDHEGDYGDKDAEIMTDEELEELMRKLKDAEEASVSPEVRFAQEAGCTPAEAKEVFEKLKALRALKDEQGRNVLQQSKNVWKDVEKKNRKERNYDRGPLRMSEGDELEYPVEAHIDLISGVSNPTGFSRQETRVESEGVFGGFEVYIAADLSGSMDEIDPSTNKKKSESQRDSVFLFIDSMMSHALEVKKHQKSYKSPLSVKVCLTVYGQETEVVLPLTSNWGPKEQLQIYRALDQVVSGGTPDHNALAMIREQMKLSKAEEEKTRAAIKKSSWQMHRFVAVFADGGSDNPAAVRAEIEAMRNEGTVVYGFGVTESGRAMEAVYHPDATTVPDTAKLPEIGMKTLVETIKKWYNV